MADEDSLPEDDERDRGDVQESLYILFQIRQLIRTIFEGRSVCETWRILDQTVNVLFKFNY